MKPDAAAGVLTRPVHTYSIVARDPATGELGVAVQSHWFSVGSGVTWAEAGVGAVATQAFAEISYGKLGLDLMRAGRSAAEALRGLLAADHGRELRQVAMVDAHGGVAVHTGARTTAAAGHVVGNQFSVQANMMLNPSVWLAMAAAFESAGGELAGRMLAALEAAEGAGGDIRGRQSAAMLVVAARPSGRPWNDRIFDLRVDDHSDPLGELRRLVTLRRAYRCLGAGDAARVRDDTEAALREYHAATELAPESLEIAFWKAVGLVNMGRVDDALPVFAGIFARDRNWIEFVRRLPASGLLPDAPRLLARIAAQGGAPS